MKKIIAGAFITVIALTGCSTTTPEGASAQNEAPAEETAPLNLTGKWIDEEADGGTQVATITADTISIDWVNEAEGTTAVYWVGTFPAPDTTDDKYDFTSTRDAEATAAAMMASTSDSKDFSYEDGVLSYTVEAVGVTKTFKLTRE
ncbi:hypothetical protein [Leucobacter sp. 1207-22]|uniref:hypothetical protein n=1 Tax=Leucobacter sp. 1207-22 TaxID=2604456 RepID=UPI0040632039